MKKSLNLLIIFSIIIITGCTGTPHTSTTSQLFVVEKGHSDDYKEYWIMAFDPNNQTKEEAFKIVVENEMAWNLMEVNRKYFASYQKKGENPWVLMQMEHLQ